MEIKLKIIVTITIIFFITGLFSIFFIENYSAEEQRAEISILGDIEYKLTNKIIKNNIIRGRSYKVSVTLQNKGNIKSDKLVVNLSDEEGFSLSNYTYLDPGETKIITFLWSTTLNRDQLLTINYFPSDLDTEWNQYNKGAKTITIRISDEDGLPATSTPGFEFLFVFMAIMLIAIISKKKK